MEDGYQDAEQQDQKDPQAGEQVRCQRHQEEVGGGPLGGGRSPREAGVEDKRILERACDCRGV